MFKYRVNTSSFSIVLKELEMATMPISVTSQFTFTPDAVYLLEGANVKMKVFEVFQSKQIGKYNPNGIH